MLPSIEDFRSVERESILTEPWPEIIPFDTPDAIGGGEFPLETLPAPLAAFCEALCESVQVPSGMVGPLALGCLSTLFQGRYTILGKPGWEEPLNLYVIVSARPSERKTPAFNALQLPFRTWEAERAEIDKVAVEQSKSRLRVLEAQLKAAEAGAAKKRGAEAEQDREDALALAEDLANFQPVHQRRLFTDDATEEALTSLMDQQGGALTLASDEGGFLSGFTRYKTTPDLDAILKSYPGTPITVDRVGRPPVRIDKPRLTVMLCCQPDVLRAFLKDALLSGRGLTARFLYSEPRSRTGGRAFDVERIPAQVLQAYHVFVRKSLDDERTGLIRLSEGATDVLRGIYDSVEAGFLNEDQAPSAEAWRGKYVGNLLRVCGLIHAAEAGDPAGELVSRETMVRAAAIADYFWGEFERINSAVSISPAEQSARYLLEKLKCLTEISRRDLHQKCRGRFKLAADIDEPLHELEERGYVRINRISTGGKPSVSVQVNPSLLQ